jgi:hypothetical protein
MGITDQRKDSPMAESLAFVLMVGFLLMVLPAGVLALILLWLGKEDGWW